jgi:hypothetical protein
MANPRLFRRTMGDVVWFVRFVGIIALVEAREPAPGIDPKQDTRGTRILGALHRTHLERSLGLADRLPHGRDRYAAFRRRD